MTPEQKDIVEIKGEIGRIRDHSDKQKIVNETNTKLLIEIRNSLVGSDLNGHNGVVYDIKNIKEKQVSHEDTLNNHKLYFKQIGLVVGAIVVAIIGVIIRIFEHK